MSIYNWLDKTVGVLGNGLYKHSPSLYNKLRPLTRSAKIFYIKFLQSDTIFLDLSGSGLCNRLKRLVSLMRFSDYFNKKLYVRWKKTFEAKCCFSDLFETELQLTSKLPKGIFSNVYISGWNFWILPSEVQGETVKINNNFFWKPIDHKYQNIPKVLQKEFLKYFNQLTPVKKLKDTIKKNSKKITKNTVGVHIRRGDFIKKYGPEMHADYKFMKAMDKLIQKNPKVNFFLATDSKDTEVLFKRRYGKKIFTYKKRSLNRNNKEGVQDALVDLLLLSKTNHIIGSHRSTFSEVAWWFGQCKAKVDIVGGKFKGK